MNKRLLSGTGLLVAAALFVAINIIANEALTRWRLDLTEGHIYTLSEGTRNILRKIDEPVTLTFYYSEKLLSGIPDLHSYGQRVRDMLEEYVSQAEGKVVLRVIDPEPFSDAEDQAVAHGLQRIPVSAAGDVAYFGLVGTNSTDDEEVIPFFSPQKEESLEYDLTKLIYKLANPQERVIGVVSSLPVMGSKGNRLSRGTPPWFIITQLRETMEVRDLGTDFTDVDDDIDTLMVIHPKKLKPYTLYAIEQFLLRGGRMMVFVDPLSEIDTSKPDPKNPLALPQTWSNMERLMKAWGVKMDKEKIATDRDAAIRVSYKGARGPQQIEYLPWLRLEGDNLNRDDFVTNQLKVINLGSAGFLRPLDGATTTITPLMQTGRHSAPLNKEAVLFVRDPAALLKQFRPGKERLTIAARITGKVKTTFPKGRPADPSGLKTDDPDFVREADKVKLIVVADTDLLTDRFWIQWRNNMGVQVPVPVADNGAFVFNAIDNLGGNDDLISLRSRGSYDRPFTRVEAIRRQAEEKFREREQALRQKLKETEEKLQSLQEQGAASGALLTAEQRKELASFREEQIKTRKELREVQHELRRSIEQLGTWLKVVNIALVPALIALLALILALLRLRQRSVND